MTSPLVATAFAELVARARGLVGDGRRAVLGITGSPGAGKSTLAEHLREALAAYPPAGLTAGEWVTHVPMDGFHLADIELDRLGLRHRKGAPETFDGFGYLEILRRLRRDEPGEVVYAPMFARDLEQPVAGAIAVRPSARLVITEGNYLLLDHGSWAELRSVLDEVWFCAPDDAVRVARLVRRHRQFGKEPDAARAWADGPDEANARQVARTRASADLVIGSAVLDDLAPR